MRPADRGGQLLAEVVLRGIDARIEINAEDRVDAVEHAARRADSLFAVEVPGRLKLVDLVFAVRQVVEAVLAVGVRWSSSR